MEGKGKNNLGFEIVSKASVTGVTLLVLSCMR